MRRIPARRFAASWTCVLALASGARIAASEPDAAPVSELAAESASFDVDVQAVLSKAGCNLGLCHGNLHGKGGFKLSLRGQHPGDDFRTITRDQLGRRVDPLRPEESLILLKPTGAVAHGGGRRFGVDSPEYAVLRKWIAAGVPRDTAVEKPVSLRATPTERFVLEPDDQVQLKVEAIYADGRVRDVTRMAVYEPSAQLVSVSHDGLARREQFGEAAVMIRYLHLQTTVRLAFVPQRPEFVWSNPPENNFVDHHVFARLKKLRLDPSPLSSDGEFVRRVYLDSIGRLPTAEEARTFVDDTAADKRARLIDTLLAADEFADWWALKWADLLRVEEKKLDRKGVEVFHGWIRQSIAEGKPLNRFVAEIIAAKGSTYKVPETNFYRAVRDPTDRGEAAAQLFLGVRLKCARCHNHPYERWTQDEYYRWSGLFAKIDYKIVENRRKDKFDKHEFEGEQIVLWTGDKEVKNPTTGRDARPAVLGDGDPIDKDQQRLELLARWLTAPENKLFAQAQVNRVWYHLLGAGIVNPVDDLRATNPPVNPELLEALADDFAAEGFDLRRLVRTIMNSRTYQLSSEPNETNADDEANFSRALIRRLPAEALLDAINDVTGAKSNFAGYPKGKRAVQIPGVKALKRREGKPTDDDRFLATFGKPERLLSSECERTDDTSLNQAFVLISGSTVQDALGQKDNRLTRWIESKRPTGEILNELYWSALSRPPTDDERTTMGAYLDDAEDRRAALEDIAWAVLNSKEFLLRR